MLVKNPPIKTQLKKFQYYLSKHYQVRKLLKIDYKQCKMILKSPVYKDFVSTWSGRYEAGGETSIIFKKYIGSVVLYMKGWKYKGRIKIYSGPCFGEPHDLNSYSKQIKKMTYLSEFLATLPSFLLRR